MLRKFDSSHYEIQYPYDEHITVTTQQSLVTIMQHLGSLIYYPF